MKKQNRSFLVWVLVISQFLMGLGALAGGACLMIKPDGSIMHMPVSMIATSPFTNFFLPGLILFTFVGLFSCAVAYSLLTLPGWNWPNLLNPAKKMHWSWAASWAAGIIVLIWITVEVQFMTIAGIHIVYWVWGAINILITFLAPVRKYCKLTR